MTDQEIKQAIATCPKGANVYVAWERPVKLRKAFKGLPLFKRTTMLLRLGVEYDHMDEVEQGRADGSLPAENAGQLGKEWVQYPTLKRSLKSGKLLLSVKLAKVFGKAVKAAETTYIVREAGIETEVKKADYEHMMLASEFNSGEMPPTFDLTVENVLRVHEAVTEDEAAVMV